MRNRTWLRLIVEEVLRFEAGKLRKRWKIFEKTRGRLENDSRIYSRWGLAVLNQPLEPAEPQFWLKTTAFYLFGIAAVL